MTNTYRQLTLDQRYQIQSDKAAGFSATETANRIGCHRSTVYRELKRCPGSSYGARRAQKASDLRRTCAYKHTKFSNQLWVRICRNIEAELSPEVIPPKIGVAQKWNILIMEQQEIPHAQITL
jgi:transposase, IS30 family